MPGVPRELAAHALKVHPDAKPVKQGLRRFDDGRRKAIGKEIIRLLAAEFIREVIWTDWVANPVLVPKKDTGLFITFPRIMSLIKVGQTHETFFSPGRRAKLQGHF